MRRPACFFSALSAACFFVLRLFLHEAVQQGQLNRIQALLAQHFNPNACHRNGQSATPSNPMGAAFNYAAALMVLVESSSGRRSLF